LMVIPLLALRLENNFYVREKKIRFLLDFSYFLVDKRCKHYVEHHVKYMKYAV